MIIVFRENQIWVDAPLWNISVFGTHCRRETGSWTVPHGKCRYYMNVLLSTLLLQLIRCTTICFDLLSALFYCIIPRDCPVTMKKSLMLVMVLSLINREGDSEWKSLSKRIQTSMFFCSCDS